MKSYRENFLKTIKELTDMLESLPLLTTTQTSDSDRCQSFKFINEVFPRVTRFTTVSDSESEHHWSYSAISLYS